MNSLIIAGGNCDDLHYSIDSQRKSNKELLCINHKCHVIMNIDEIKPILHEDIYSCIPEYHVTELAYNLPQSWVDN